MDNTPDENVPENFTNDLRITLAGKAWAIPPLSARRIIRFGGKIVGLNLNRLSEDGLMTVYQAVHVALETAYPQLTLDQFLDMPVTMDEVLEAMPVLMKASGMKMKKIEPGEAEGAPN